MPILLVEHAVRDYEGWKRSFDGDPVGRQQGGVRRYRVLRATDEPKRVLIELEFDAMDEADAFRTRLQELWGRVGSDLGLEGPRARILEEVEDKEY